MVFEIGRMYERIDSPADPTKNDMLREPADVTKWCCVMPRVAATSVPRVTWGMGCTSYLPHEGASDATYILVHLKDDVTESQVVENA